MSAQLQENDVEQETDAPDAAIEAQAKEMGWVPKEKYRGLDGKWVTAAEFIDRGQHIMPLLKANNDRLKKDLLTRDAKIATLETAVQEATKSIKAMQKNYTEATEHRVAEAEKELKAKIREAKRAGDVEAELALTDSLDTLQEQKAEAERKAPEQESTPTPKQPADEPYFQEWMAENSWFGNLADPDSKDRTEHIQWIGYRLNQSQPTLRGTAFLEECVRIMEEEREEGKDSRPGPRRGSKVEGSSSPGRTVSKRPFDNLPSDVKKVCREQASDFVGKGKPFADAAAWEDHFAKTYLD